MTFSALKIAALPFALFFTSGQVSAEEAAPLGYKDSMRCMAIYSMISAALSDDKNADPNDIAALDDKVLRWMILAMIRDGEEGKRTERDIETVIDALVVKIESYGEDDASAEAFFMQAEQKCASLEIANADEFNGVDTEAADTEKDEGSTS